MAIATNQFYIYKAMQRTHLAGAVHHITGTGHG